MHFTSRQCPIFVESNHSQFNKLKSIKTSPLAYYPTWFDGILDIINSISSIGKSGSSDPARLKKNFQSVSLWEQSQGSSYLPKNLLSAIRYYLVIVMLSIWHLSSSQTWIWQSNIPTFCMFKWVAQIALVFQQNATSDRRCPIG